MVSNSDPNYPKGFRDNQGIEPEPRLGIAWDITGDAKTALHASVGAVPQPARQRQRHGRDGAESAGAEHAEHHLRDAWTRCSPPARRARSRIVRAASSASSATRKTPKSYNYSAGIQRELGWGTVLDVTYAGFQMRHGEMSTQHQRGSRRGPVPRRQPAECGIPQNPTTAKPNEFLRPYFGYQDITIRSHFGTRDVQLAAGAAQSPLHQRPAVRRRLHAGKTVSARPNRSAVYNPLRPGDAWNVAPDESHAAPQPGRQLHLGRPERQPHVGQHR